ncbi:MAG: hypothetical protein ACFFD2_00490 [Promethearchaeota archaeon]
MKTLIGKSIKSIKELKWDTFGVKIAGDDIIGIALHKRKLTILPQSVGNLKSLQVQFLGYNKLKHSQNRLDSQNHFNY